MKWATRAGIHVDRAACAWLIDRFVDEAAEFVYVTDPADVPSDATPFDMLDCALSHHGQDVSFETILRHNELVDPVLWRIGQIVHQADVDDDLHDAPEADGLDLIIRALGVDHDDEGVRVLTSTIFDSMYRYLRRETLGHEHPGR